MELELVVARLPPGKSGAVAGWSPDALAVNPASPRWLRLSDGVEVPAPATGEHEFTAWKAGQLGLRAPPILPLPVTIDDYVLRTMPAGDAMLLATASKKSEARALYWLVGDRLILARKAVADGARAEVIGAREAVLWDPEARRLELFTVDDLQGASIELPAPLARRSDGGANRFVYARPDRDVLAFDLLQATAWLRISALRAAAHSDRVRWTFKQVVPGALEESKRFEVIFASPTMVMLQSGAERATLKIDTAGLAKGDAVTLHRRLWTSGTLTYAQLEHTGARRWIAPFPELAPEEHPVARGGPAPGRAQSRQSWSALVEALHDAGLLQRLDAAGREELLDALESERVEAEALLHRYYAGDEARMRADGFFTHDWRFDSGAVLALLGDLAGRPLLELVEEQVDPRRDDRLVKVRRSSGAVLEKRVEQLDELVALFNLELEAVGEPRRFRALPASGDEYAYLLVTDAQRAKLAPLLELE